RRRPDIRAAELAAMAQSAQIGIAEANLYPAFSLIGSFGTAASNVGQNRLKRVFEGRGITFAFGPAFQWNILNYGQITNTVRVEGDVASVYRALGGRWQIRADRERAAAATAEEMRRRTDWGELLAPRGTPQPPAPGLLTAADVSPNPPPPEW